MSALCLAATSEAAVGEVFNVGGPDELSLRELAELVTRLGGGSYRTVPFPEDRLAIDIGDYFADDRQAARTARVAADRSASRTGCGARSSSTVSTAPAYWGDAS